MRETATLNTRETRNKYMLLGGFRATVFEFDRHELMIHENVVRRLTLTSVASFKRNLVFPQEPAEAVKQQEPQPHSDCLAGALPHPGGY